MPDSADYDATASLARLLDEALKTMAQTIQVAGEKTAADAVEFLADYLNGADAVEDGDIAAFQRWVDRGRP